MHATRTLVDVHVAAGQVDVAEDRQVYLVTRAEQGAIGADRQVAFAHLGPQVDEARMLASSVVRGGNTHADPAARGPEGQFGHPVGVRAHLGGAFADRVHLDVGGQWPPGRVRDEHEHAIVQARNQLPELADHVDQQGPLGERDARSTRLGLLGGVGDDRVEGQARAGAVHVGHRQRCCEIDAEREVPRGVGGPGHLSELSAASANVECDGGVGHRFTKHIERVDEACHGVARHGELGLCRHRHVHLG